MVGSEVVGSEVVGSSVGAGVGSEVVGSEVVGSEVSTGTGSGVVGAGLGVRLGDGVGGVSAGPGAPVHVPPYMPLMVRPTMPFVLPSPSTSTACSPAARFTTCRTAFHAQPPQPLHQLIWVPSALKMRTRVSLTTLAHVENWNELPSSVTVKL